MAVNESSSPDLEVSTDVATCKSCQALNDVVNYCVTCREECCMNCTDTLHDGHNTLPHGNSIVKSMRLFLSDTCNFHKDEKLFMYCVTCKMPCCVSCIDENHDGHPMSTMKSIAKQADSMYTKLVDSLPQISSRYSQRKTEYEKYVHSVDAAISGIKSQFEQLRLSIDEMETTMIEPLEKEVCKVRKQNTNIQQSIQEAEFLVHLYNEAKKENSNLQKAIFFSNCPILDDWKLSIDSYPEPISFKPTKMKYPSTKELIGVVEGHDGELLLGEETANARENVPILNMLSLVSLNDFHLHGRVVPTDDGCKFLASNSKAFYSQISKQWIYGATSLTIVYSNQSKRAIFTLEDEIDVTDASLIPPSDLVFTDSIRKKVWRVNNVGTKKLIADTSPITPTGICYTRDKELVLGLKKQGKTARSLMRMYSLTNLNSLGEIEKDDQGNPLFSDIKNIIQNSKEDFIVHDGNSLMCVSKQGISIWRIKKDFNEFCCDKFFNVVVATNDEIRILDPKGEYIKTLLTKLDFLTKPTSLSIDKEGLLWIGQESSVKVVKYWK